MNKTKKSFLCAAIATMTLLAGCGGSNSDNPNPSPGKSHKAKLVVGINMQPLAQNGYLVPIKDITVKSVKEGGKITGGVETKFSPYIIPSGDDFFYIPGMMSENFIIKYSRGDDGKLIEKGRLQISSMNAVSGIAVLNADKAYASAPFDQKIVVFNPTTMKKIGEINLAKPEFSVNKTKPAPSPMGLIISDGILYCGTGQFVKAPVTAKGAYMIPIDTKTDKPGKMFSDNRLSSATIFPCGMFTDEKGDIYVTCWGSYGYAGAGQKFGLLRIKKGQKRFDPDYCFNMSDMTIDGVKGGKLSYSINNIYVGNGRMFLYGACYSLAAKPANPDPFSDKILYCMKADIQKKTIEVLPLPNSNMYSEGLAQYGDDILFGLSPKDKPSGIYTYNLKTGKCSETAVVEVPGTILGIIAWK